MSEASIPKTKTRFLEIKCIKCSKTRKVFSASNREIKCKGCDEVLVYPSASKAVIQAKVVKVL